ncbi:hypothetical protein ACIBI9_43265 [Nonomuraea sp. NPDC050451]|uniref:hypothetical protein n=1 Tax=Nonomuraea sp. NPDC050451 TaxID=3364364 RepID=UPI0037BCAA83
MTDDIAERRTGPMNPYDGFFSWSAQDQNGRGACGVTNEPARAEARLNAALDTLEAGAVGVVELVRLDREASQPAYVHGAVLLRSRRRDTLLEVVTER